MSRKRKNEPNKVLTDIRIEKAAAEGNSLAHVDGKVLFVSYSAPGDLADVEVVRQKSGYMQGRIAALKEVSPLREQPFCEHFGLCGGCKWQHLQYQEQLQQKQAQVRDNLERIGKVALPSDFPILGAEANRYYRNKLEFTFAVKRWLSNEEVVSGEAMSEADRQGLGFHLAGKFDKVLDLKQCWLQPEPSNEIRLFVKKTAQELGLTFYDVRARQGYMRNLMIRNTSAGQFMLVVIISAEPTPAFETLMRRVAEVFPCITSLMYAVNTKSNDSMADLEMRLFAGEPFITMRMPAYRSDEEELKFRVGPKSFYQTNTAQAVRLYRLAADFAQVQPDELVYDLYTGTGTIANYVARSARKVIGIEYVEDAVRDARVNQCGFRTGAWRAGCGYHRPSPGRDAREGGGMPDGRCLVRAAFAADCLCELQFGHAGAGFAADGCQVPGVACGSGGHVPAYRPCGKRGFVGTPGLVF